MKRWLCVAAVLGISFAVGCGREADTTPVASPSATVPKGPELTEPTTDRLARLRREIRGLTQAERRELLERVIDVPTPGTPTCPAPEPRGEPSEVEQERLERRQLRDEIHRVSELLEMLREAVPRTGPSPPVMEGARPQELERLERLERVTEERLRSILVLQDESRRSIERLQHLMDRSALKPSNVPEGESQARDRPKGPVPEPAPKPDLKPDIRPYGEPQERERLDLLMPKPAHDPLDDLFGEPQEREHLDRKPSKPSEPSASPERERATPKGPGVKTEGKPATN